MSYSIYITQKATAKLTRAQQLLWWPTVPKQSEPKSVGCCAPFRGGRGRDGSASNTMSPGPRPTSVPSGILMHPVVWRQQTWAEKWGLPCSLTEEGEKQGPHLTQCCLGRGISPYQVASWSIEPFGYNRHGENWGLCPFGEGELGPHHNVAWAEAYLRTKWHPKPSNHLATIHQCYRQTDRQRSDSTGRTILQMVAPKKNKGKYHN